MVARSRREIIHWLAASGVLHTLSRAQSDEEPNYDDGEAYRVYSTLIPQDWIWLTAKAESLVIQVQTVSSKICLEPEGESAGILAPAIANYKDLVTKRWRLMPEFSLSKPYTLVDQQEIDSYFHKGGSG